MVLRDGFEDTDEEKARLRYPFAEGPQHGGAVELAPGVLWLRMPLGGSLAHVNVWGLKDGDGWAIVDTGMQTEATAIAWNKVFADVFHGAPVTRVIGTHMHPDHIGMSGWITEKFDARFWITRTEYMMCRMLAGDTGRQTPDDALRFYKAAGWSSEHLDTYRARFGGFGRSMHALPDSYRRMQDGEVIRIGEYDWKVVVGKGHSPEHACLWCEELKFLISGDQVLPRITSNVSVFPTEPEGNPLEEWLVSLDRVGQIVPDDVLVLPAHNDPFYGLHARLDQLIWGHETALSKLVRLIETPKRSIDVFDVLFKRKITPELVGMATGESLAHLNCLLERRYAVKQPDEHGVDWYQAA
jgi:glyoxylase-like metal-dependent hydrolase (beta-lactamase superfamily II)